MPLPRIEPDPVETRYVQKFYGCTCAGCGRESKDPQNGHLYEDATERKADRYSLIILCSDCNLSEQRDRTKATREVESLDPKAVRQLASDHYRKGAYAQAYASSRFAAHLFERCGQYTHAVDCLTEAISALRPIRRGGFIRETLVRAQRLCEQHKIGSHARWLFLDRFALSLYDYALWKDCLDVQIASRLLLQNLPPENNPQQFAFDEANSFRRHAMIRASTNTPDKGETVEKFVSRLSDDATGFEAAYQWDSFATNLDVAGKLSAEVLGRAGQGHKFSQRALSRTGQVKHWWVLQEHHFREASYYHGRGAKAKAHSAMMAGLAIRSKYPVMLEPVLERGGPVRHSVDEKIKLFGMNWDQILEEDPDISRNAEYEEPIGLDSLGIERTTKSILGGGKCENREE